MIDFILFVSLIILSGAAALVATGLLIFIFNLILERKSS